MPETATAVRPTASGTSRAGIAARAGRVAIAELRDRGEREGARRDGAGRGLGRARRTGAVAAAGRAALAAGTAIRSRYLRRRPQAPWSTCAPPAASRSVNAGCARPPPGSPPGGGGRSEEHTSELQSRSDLV